MSNKPFDPTIDRCKSPTGIEREQIGSIVDELTTAFNRVSTFGKRRNTRTQRYEDDKSNEKQDFSMITGNEQKSYLESRMKASAGTNTNMS